MENYSQENGSQKTESKWKLSFLDLEEKHYDRILKWGIFISLVTLIVLLIVFKWNHDIKSESGYVVDNDLLGTFGDFFGGVIGTFFGILAALIMFSTLKSQRELQKNSDKLQKEIAEKSIESQKELALIATQTQDRLAQNQEAEAKLQRFNSLFFELLSLFRSQREELNNSVSEAGKPRNYFDVKMLELYDKFEPSSKYGSSYNKASDDYLDFYHEHATELAPIFRSLYRLMDLIECAKIDSDEKRQYAKIVRAQLGEGELFFLRYNATTEYGKKFQNYITKYNLLKHLPTMSLLELKTYRKKMDKDKDHRSLGMNILIQKLRKELYCRTVFRDEYDDLENVRVFKHSKYEVDVDMSDTTCTVLKVIEKIEDKNKSSIFKAFLRFDQDDVKKFLKFVMREIYEGSNFYTFNELEGSDLKCDFKSRNDEVNKICVYTVEVYIHLSGRESPPLRMSHPDWEETHNPHAE